MDTEKQTHAPSRDRIVIGGSYGSLDPLQRLLADLPANLTASVFVVQHRLAGGPDLAALLAPKSTLPVRLAEDNSPILPGTVYLAPADQHLLLDQNQMRVVRGPREKLARPSIDVLFRSAAVEFGSRVIGVILSGALNDGAAGLEAIRRCGGYSIVQEPSDAIDGELPRAALRTSPNACLTAADIGSALAHLADQLAPAPTAVPPDLALEARAAAAAMIDPTQLNSLGEVAHINCPECDGPLWRIAGSTPEQFRCDIGHAFTTETLAIAQARALEGALWVAYRTLLERSRLLEEMARTATEHGRPATAESLRQRRDELKHHSEAVMAAFAAIEQPNNQPIGDGATT
jgi:two-component system chemotaxis response regulator CheB